MQFQTRIVSPGGIILKESPWQKNLIMDQGLNNLAQKSGGCGPCGLGDASKYCLIGSGTNPVLIPSSPVTVSQSTTTVTASGSFFTAGMVGAILKYGHGTSGAEVYITGFTDATHVTVNTSATVASVVCSVWMVQQTALQTQLFVSNTYQTSGSSCGTTFSSPNITLQRTYVFPTQGSPYTVNEIGWSPVNSGPIMGRAVLAVSDVVGTGNFYVVVIAITYTYFPSSPQAFGNVGTNLDTTGTAMMEFFAVSTVNSSGVTDVSAGFLDATQGAWLTFPSATYTQQSAIANSVTTTWPSRIGDLTFGAWTYTASGLFGSLPGQMQSTTDTPFSTAGTTIYGIGLTKAGSSANGPAFDVKLTTPFNTPTGTFEPITIFQVTYGRGLNNP